MRMGYFCCLYIAIIIPFFFCHYYCYYFIPTSLSSCDVRNHPFISINAIIDSHFTSSMYIDSDQLLWFLGSSLSKFNLQGNDLPEHTWIIDSLPGPYKVKLSSIFQIKTRMMENDLKYMHICMHLYLLYTVL